jgi:hypothetical protein
MDISKLEAGALRRLLAVEVLLSEPDELNDDVLEACLYIQRDRLTGKAGDAVSAKPRAREPGRAR